MKDEKSMDRREGTEGILGCPDSVLTRRLLPLSTLLFPVLLKMSLGHPSHFKSFLLRLLDFTTLSNLRSLDLVFHCLPLYVKITVFPYFELPLEHDFSSDYKSAATPDTIPSDVPAAFTLNTLRGLGNVSGRGNYKGKKENRESKD